MATTDILDLSDFFITKSQANDFAIRLNTIVEQMYTTNFNLEQAIHTQFGIQQSDIFLKLLREHKLQNGSLQDIQIFLNKIQEILKNLSVVSLTLAFEPSDEVLKSLTQWCALNLQKQVVLDVQIDPHIIAGVKINYNGRFKDYSVTSIFNTLVSNMLHTPSKQSILHQNAQLITIGR